MFIQVKIDNTQQQHNLHILLDVYSCLFQTIQLEKIRLVN